MSEIEYYPRPNDYAVLKRYDSDNEEQSKALFYAHLMTMVDDSRV